MFEHTCESCDSSSPFFVAKASKLLTFARSSLLLITTLFVSFMMLAFTCKKVIATDIKQCKEIIEKRNWNVTLSFNI